MHLVESDWEHVDERARDFTGRGWVFERVRTFLASDARLLVIVAPPGTGKTAIAARLAQASGGRLADQPVQAVPVGTIAAAAFCRAGQVSLMGIAEDLSRQLAEARPEFRDALEPGLVVNIHDSSARADAVASGGIVALVNVKLSGLEPRLAFDRGVALPLQRLSQRPGFRPPVLLVDSLDEAYASLVAQELPRLLADLTGARLVLTTRDDPRVLAELGIEAMVATAKTVRIHLVDDAPAGIDEVADYAAARLQGRGSDDALTVLSGRIGAAAQGNFLYAYHVLRSLLAPSASGGLDVAGAAAMPLPDGLSGVYRDFLRRRLTTDRERWRGLVRPILAPIAVALGDGLDTAHLASVGTALTRKPLSISDARDVTEDFGQFLDGPRPDGPFRVYHRSFSDFLLDAAENRGHPVDAIETHAAIVEGLSPAVGDGATDWTAADPYARANLAEHAAACGRLDGLLTHPGFLVVADIDRLLPLVRQAASAEAREAAVVVHLTAPNLRGRPAEERGSYLEMAARQSGHNALADKVGALQLDRPWKTLWAHWHAGGGLLVGNHVGGALALAATVLGRRSLVISGGADGTLRVWNLETRSPVTDPLIGHRDAVTAVTVGMLAGRAVIVSGGVDATVRRWDLETGRSLGDPLVGHDGVVRSVGVAKLAGRKVIVSGGDDGTVRRWDLETGRSLGDVLVGHKNPVLAVAVGELVERPIIVTGDSHATVRRWDLETGRRIGNRLVRHKVSGESFALAVGQHSGRPFVASGRGRTVRWWDMKTASPVGEPLVSRNAEEHRVDALTVGELEGRTVVVSGDNDRCIRAWDVETGRLLRERFVEHDVKAIAWSELASGPVAISAGADGTVRLSEMAGTGSAGFDRLTSYSVSAIATRERASQGLVVSGGTDGMLRRWDMETGRPVGSPIKSQQGPVKSIVVVELPASSLIVSGGSDATVRRWNLETGSLLGQLLASRENAPWGVSAMTVVELEDRPFIATDANESVCLWDLKTGRLIREFDACRSDWAVRSWPRALAIGKIDGRSVLVSGGAQAGIEVVTHGRTQLHYYTDPVGTVCRWDMLTGDPIGQPLTVQNGQVRAVAAGVLADAPVVVAGGDDTLVHVWNMMSGAPICEPLAGHRAPVTSVALGACAGRPVILSGDSIGTVRVRELDNSPRLVIDTGAEVTGLAATTHPGVAIATAHGLLLCTWN